MTALGKFWYFMIDNSLIFQCVKFNKLTKCKEILFVFSIFEIYIKVYI
jgi:hypothetical protein